MNLAESLIHISKGIMMLDEGKKMTDEEKDSRWGPVVGTHESESQPGKKYEVRRKGPNQYSCQCKGWIFHHKCKHCEAEAKKKGEKQDAYDFDFKKDSSGKSDKAA